MTDPAPIPPPATGTPHFVAPAGACDSHTHVFGPADRFRPSQPLVYPLPDATPEAHARMRQANGIDRAVLVQPAPYAADPAAMLAAVAASGGTLKAVAVALSPDAPLGQWAEAGVVGLRFTEARTPDGKRYPGSVGFDALIDLAPAMRSAGLHAQLWAPAAVLDEHLPQLLRLGLPIVIDHIGMPDRGEAGGGAAFRRLRSYVRDADLWVKLTLCRVGRPDLDEDDDLRQLHRRMIEARPERMLWGSDWPYVRMTPAPDAATMLDIFADWAGDPDLARRILVDNPNRLFAFEETT